MDRSAALSIPEEKEVSIPHIRERIAALEQSCKACPEQVEIDVMHHFSSGVYARTVLMKAGDLVVGKIHKLEHIVVVSAGRASVVSEEFGSKEIVAPAVFKSRPGVKRALFIHEDMVWTTIHKNETNTEDLATLEEMLIAKDYSDLPEDVV